MRHFILTTGTALCLGASIAFAQTGTMMTEAQLVKLTARGVVLKLGGEGEGYTGELTLKTDGSGKGSARTDAGKQIRISGTWVVRDGKFCRTWAKLDGGKEVCETWYLTSGRSVEVFNGKNRMGVNSW